VQDLILASPNVDGSARGEEVLTCIVPHYAIQPYVQAGQDLLLPTKPVYFRVRRGKASVEC